MRTAVLVLALAAAAGVQANAPCSLPVGNNRGGAPNPCNNAKNGCPLYCGGGGSGRGPPYFQCRGTKASGGYTSHHAPLASFAQPQKSLEALKGAARGVKGHVGSALGGVKRKWAEHRAARRAARAEAAAERPSQAQAQPGEKRGGGLFRLGGAPPRRNEEDEEEIEAEEAAAGQDPRHLHEQALHHYDPSSSSSSQAQAQLRPHATPSPLREEDMGPALLVLGRGTYEAAALLRAELAAGKGYHQAGAPRLPLKRRALTYGHWAVDLLGYGVKLVAILLFQTLGAALAVNEYNATGLVSRTLIRYSGLLAGLAFLPPLAVALREALPSHARNPFVRAVSRVLELALDVVSVSAVALAASILLTSAMALPGLHDRLLSYQLGEEFIKGALSSGAVLFFLWAFAKNFEPLATKWFV